MNLGNHDFEAASSDENAGNDPLRRAVLNRIIAGHQSTSGWSLSRAVWRAGELRLRDAELHLIRLIGTGAAMLDYSIAWSLAQCGGEKSFAALRQLSSHEKTSSVVRRIAADAMLQCAPAIERPRLIDRLIVGLPAALHESARNGPADAFQRAMREHLDSADQQTASVLETIYSIDNQHVRPALLDAVRTLPLEPPLFQRIRHIFKSAEMRRDAEVFGQIARRFETVPSTFRTDWRYKPTSAADAQKAFSSQTRTYLRRRVWRTLKRLGELGDDDYVRMASGVLLSFADDDARRVQSEGPYDPISRSFPSIYYDYWGKYWSFCQILFGKSPRYVACFNLTFLCAGSYQLGDPEPAEREEAFPELWDRNPAALLRLLGASRCEVVHRFAVKALRACDEFCRSLDDDALKLLLGARYDVTVELGIELAVRRYDPANPNFDLVLALADCSVERGRRQALQWIAEQPDDVLKRSESLLVALTRHPHGDVRSAIRPTVQRLIAYDSPLARRISERLIDAILTPGAPKGVPSHTAHVLREDFGDKLGWVPQETVWRLLQSRSGPAQEVGGLLLANNVRPDVLEVDQIVRLTSHDILAVREAAWKICRGSVARLRREIESALRLLDAKWEDSRRFAFDLFREHFTTGELTPELLVGICDSVRPDVQQFGRELITECFQDEHGQEYLLKLSEHPAAALQQFATNYLDRYAADDIERLRELTPFFVSVLLRVNQGRVAKDRVLALLGREALKSEQAAGIVAEILTRISATCAIGDKAATLEAMLDIHETFPDIPLPFTVQPVEVR